MHGLPVLFSYVALPAIDVQSFPKAVLATGEIEAIKNPAQWPGSFKRTCISCRGAHLLQNQLHRHPTCLLQEELRHLAVEGLHPHHASNCALFHYLYRGSLPAEKCCLGHSYQYPCWLSVQTLGTSALKHGSRQVAASAKHWTNGAKQKAPHIGEAFLFTPTHAGMTG